MSVLICDIETFPIDDAEQFLTFPEPPTVPDLTTITAAKNVKKPELVEASLEQRRQAAIEGYETAVAAYNTQRANMIDRCAFDPDLACIVALGWMHPGDSKPIVVTCPTQTKERDALEMFWREARDLDLVTFNGLRFDLPMLMRRSMYLGVPCPVLNVDRYRSPHIDLMARLTYNGVLSAHSLKFYLARLGIAVDDVHTGKDIAGLVRAGDWDGVKAHCAADVLGTKLLAERLGYIRRVSPVHEPQMSMAEEPI